MSERAPIIDPRRVAAVCIDVPAIREDVESLPIIYLMDDGSTVAVEQPFVLRGMWRDWLTGRTARAA